jgi:hypothetical protein
MRWIAACIVCGSSLVLRAAALDKSVVLYLPFDEGTGTKAKDLSDSKTDGELKEGPKWVDGKFGKALEFNGKSNYVEVPLDVNNHLDGELSICAWVKVLEVNTDGHNQTRQPIVMKGAGGQWEFALYIYDSWGAGMSFWQCGGTGVSEPGVGNVVQQNQWHAVCGTFKLKGSTNVYVDGKVVTSGAGRNGDLCATGTRPVRIGSREDGQFLKAVIDDVRIYSRELSAAEVVEGMAKPLAGLAVEPDGRAATTWAALRRVR